MKSFTAATFFTLSFILPASAPPAASAKGIVATWKYVLTETTRPDGSKVDTYGKAPKRIIVFVAGGHFALFIAKPDPVKFASNSRLKGTPDEYEAAVHNSIAYYGTYKVDAAAKTLTWTIEAATFPNWYGITQNRHISINGDELRITNKVGSSGGAVLSVLKRLN